MLSWEETDKLNEIANDPTMSAEERTARIRAYMGFWGMLVNEGSDAWDFCPNWTDPRIPREPVIDPYTQSRGGIPLTGQVGTTYHPGY